MVPPDFLLEASQGWARLSADSTLVSTGVICLHLAGLLPGGGAAVAADGATIDRDNGVIVVRYQGRVFAFNLSCPHENAAVRWKAAALQL